MRALAALCAIVAMTEIVHAAELLMYRREGCPWCAAWDREIGPIYPKTGIGQRVPIRMVDLDWGKAPAIRVRSPIRYSPTFILVEDGQEVGRIEGYPGDAFFWGLLESLMQQLRSSSPMGESPTGADVRMKERST